MSLGVLVSGNLGFVVLKHLHQNQNVKFVLTDKKSFLIIEFCKTNEIEIFIGNPRNPLASNFFSNHKIEVLISVNYLFLIGKDLIDLPSKLAFNLHGSLLPKYRGRTPHVWAIINNENQTGITAHLIDENCDTGHIIEQVVVKIEENDSGNDLLKKYNKLYTPLIDKVLKNILNNNLTFTQQQNELATYFGKRTPEDGLINWNWQKERINNWVRAQSFPYPGAFTFYENRKIIIDKVLFSEIGYDDSIPNGTIIQTDPDLIIKTSNGGIKLEEIRNNKEVFIKNKILS